MHSRDLLNSLQLRLSHLRDLARIKHLPGVILDEPDALQDLGREPHTLVRDLHHLLALREHDAHEHELDREAEDEHAEAYECRGADLCRSG